MGAKETKVIVMKNIRKKRKKNQNEEKMMKKW